MVDTFGVHRQETSFAAFNGRNYLFLWRDYRNRDTTDIYGMRLAPEGIRLDPQRPAVSTTPSWREYPVAVFDRTNCLVVWEERRNHSEYSDVHGARVTPAGQVLDPAGIPISTAARNQYEPAVAFNGTDYAVVGRDHRRGARVTPDGKVLNCGQVVTQEGSRPIPLLA